MPAAGARRLHARHSRLGAGADGPTARRAIADSIRLLRNSADTAALDAVVRSASYRADGEIYAAATDVAVSASASIPARGAALMILVGYASPRQLYSLRHFLGADAEARSCVGHGTGRHHTRKPGNPPPEDRLAALRAIGLSLRDDATLPDGLRFAGGCLMRMAERAVRLQDASRAP